ncbi:MAG: hypothetical protein ACOC89_00460 [Candidatus Saliniplasma sp.]
MSLESFMEKGKIKTFRTSDHRFISTIAVKMVKDSDKKALIIDGSARIDPYWMVRICKKLGLNEEKVLTRIILCRGFTAYQLRDMVDKAEEIVRQDDNIVFLGLIDLSSRFLEDLNSEEGTWLRAKCIRKLKSIVEEQDIYCAVADPYVEVFKTYPGGEIYGKKCANLQGGTR